MKLPRIASMCVSTAMLLSLLACSDDETLVALTIDVTDDVGDVSRVHVVLSQSGKPNVDLEITDHPEQDADGNGGGTAVRIRDFYRRIKLPDSWEDGTASADVHAYPEGSTEPPIEGHSDFKVLKGETVAAFVDIARPAPEPEGGAGGMDGEGTAGTGGGGDPTAGTGGTGGATAGTGGSTDGAGTGGTGGTGGAEGGAPNGG